MKTLLYPGSFDPVTRGHLDVIRRASRLCDTLIVAVMHNVNKRGALTIQERMDFLRRACAGMENVRVIAHSGLLTQCVQETRADAVVRGVRTSADFESEMTAAQLNRMLGGTETLLLPTCSELSAVSSSVVREIAAFDGDIAPLVPENLAEEIRAALSAENRRAYG